MGTLAYLQGGASSVADNVDALWYAITAVAVFFTVAIFVGIIYLTVKYRRGAHADRSNPPLHSLAVELAWTIVPLAIVMGIFVWSAGLFFHITRGAPADAMEVYVVGKQWMWKLQQPNGKWENNELHVPVGKPVQLVMTSEDVIHSFWVPAFRVKQDVIPGQFTRLWFTPTKPGKYHLFCAEFCGTLHSTMVGTVYVMEPSEYEAWLNEGNVGETVAQQGEALFMKYGCSGCHGPNANVRAPALEGIFGKAIPVQIPRAGTPLEQVEATTRIADTRYLHDAIVLPEQEVAAGYRPIMPSYRNQLSEEQVFQLVAYIRSLSDRRPAGSETTDYSGRLTPEDYKARTGFVPENVNRITGQGNTAGGGNAGGNGSNGRTRP
ncbi:MAG: cytochrome c oxidase subunit II [Armatimonadota bacterium]